MRPVPIDAASGPPGGERTGTSSGRPGLVYRRPKWFLRFHLTGKPAASMASLTRGHSGCVFMVCSGGRAAQPVEELVHGGQRTGG